MGGSAVPTELGTKPIGALIKQYAVPGIIAMTASSLYNMVNSGLLGGIFGRPPAPFPGVVPGERLVSREVLDLTTENSMLKANAHADAMNAAQMVVNATQAAQIACQQRQIDQLFGLTRLVVPNGNLNPGYGPAFVSPGVPPPPPLPDATIQAIAAAVAAQTAKEAA